jgi:Ecdysteroid kinase-like family
MSIGVPREPTEIERWWIADLLSERSVLPNSSAVKDVSIVETKMVGMTSSITRVGVSYTSPIDAPASLIVKLPAADPKWRRIVNDARLFEREAGFYSDMQPSFCVRTPYCYLCHVDYEGDRSVLVLEDLLTYGAQRQDAELSQSEISLALECLAAFQAQYWGGQSLGSQTWLAHLERFDEKACEVAVGRAEGVFSEVIGEAGSAVGHRFVRGQAGLYRRLAEAPATFVHNDYRPDNLFFGNDGTLALIDFQASFCGSPAIDLAMLLMCGLSIEDRRIREDNLLLEYSRSLQTHGVHYGSKQLVEDYRAGLLYLWPRALVAFSLLADKSNQAQYAYQSEFMRRTVAAFEDHSCIDMLD